MKNWKVCYKLELFGQKKGGGLVIDQMYREYWSDSLNIVELFQHYHIGHALFFLKKGKENKKLSIKYYIFNFPPILVV